MKRQPGRESWRINWFGRRCLTGIAASAGPAGRLVGRVVGRRCYRAKGEAGRAFESHQFFNLSADSVFSLFCVDADTADDEADVDADVDADADADADAVVDDGRV